MYIINYTKLEEIHIKNKKKLKYLNLILILLMKKHNWNLLHDKIYKIKFNKIIEFNHGKWININNTKKNLNCIIFNTNWKKYKY